MAADRNCVQRELLNTVEDAGFSESLTDFHQLCRSIIRLSHPVGAIITSPIELTPVEVSASRSTDHPAYPLYNPIIPIHDANHDISTAEVPQSVITELNAHKFKFGSTTDFAATLAGGVLTFADITDNTAMISALIEMGVVNRWYGSNEAANYGASGALWTGPRAYCVTISGVNYAITAVSLASRTITLASPPADGSVTVTIHPFRIAGSTSTSRIRRISGEALVAAGDITGEIAVGSARMGKILGHRHEINTRNASGSGIQGLQFSLGLDQNIPNTVYNFAGNLITDGTNTLVTGKSNDPRTAGMAVYMHLGVLLAKTWTTNA